MKNTSLLQIGTFCNSALMLLSDHKQVKLLTPWDAGVASKYVLSANSYYCYSWSFVVTSAVKSTGGPAVHGRTPTTLPS